MAKVKTLGNKLRVQDVLDRLKITKPSLYRYISDGDFPKPHLKIKGVPLWDEARLAKYIDGISRADNEATA